jgi:HK97 family phage prohead protease
MQAPPIDLVRGLTLAPVLRTDGDGDDGPLGTMTGYFSQFNTWYEVDSLFEGRFLEQVAPGATAQTIAEDRDSMRVLFDHGFDSIGNKVLGPIETLEERAKGPYYEVPLFDTSYNRDLLPGLRAGVYGASFRMRVLDESWADEPKPSRRNPKGWPERTILRVKVMEFGPVTFPANPKASAGVRSLTDPYYDRLRQRDAGAFEAAVRAAGRSIEDLTGRPGARSAGGGDHDAEPRKGNAPTVISTKQRLDDGALRMRRIKQ